MIKNYILLLGIIGLATSAFSQNLLLMNSDTTYMESKAWLNLNVGADWRSNSLTNLFADRMAFGGLVDRELKGSILENLDTFNRVGGNLIGGISYYSFNDTLFNRTKWGTKIQIEQHVEGFLTFSNDLFKLSFEGNTPYLGQEMNLNNSDFGFYSYQKFGFGIFNKKNFSEITLSYVNGNSFTEMQVPSASLYSSELGDTLALNVVGEINKSDPSNTSIGSSNGFGMALDFKANFPLYDKKGYIMLEMNNLGFIKWNKKSIRQTMDTTFTYVGEDITNLLDTAYNSTAYSFADSTSYRSDTTSTITMLPTFAKVTLLRNIKEKDYLEMGIIIRAYRAFTPQLFVGYNYFMNENAQIGVMANFGGYGRFRVGASYQQYWRKMYFTIATEDVAGLIMDDAKGRGAYFTIGKFFGKRNND